MPFCIKAASKVKDQVPTQLFAAVLAVMCIF